ncbi:MAG: DUF790 family protein, partial [Candidatus Hodarchaeota archaeon]
MVTVGSIPIQYNKKLQRFIPIFLSKEDNQTIEKAIAIFQGNQGINRSDYVNEDFLQNFSDLRMASVLHEVLITRFFGFQPISNGYTIARRIPIWKALAKKMPKAFAASAEDRRRILIELSRELGVESPELLEKRIFFDHRDFQKLAQISEPSAQAVIKSYNRLILSVLVQNASWLRFSIDSKADLKGIAFKKLLFLAKRNGIYLEVFTENQRRVIELLGPKRLVLRGTRYSACLGKMLRAAAAFALGGKHALLPIVEVGLPRGKGERIVQLPISALEWIREEKDEKMVFFDSEVEKKLYFQLSGGSWKIDREPFLHFEKESIFFLPDFRLDLCFKPVTVYIELVGYWTKEYLEKKMEKLNRLPSEFKNLILVADSALAFPETRFKTFYYQSLKDMPVGQILRYLEEEYVRPHSKIKQRELLENADFLAKKVQHALVDSHLLEMATIQEIIDCQDSKISSRVIKALIDDRMLIDCNFIPGFGIIHSQLTVSVKETISALFAGSQQEKPWSAVKIALKDLVPQKAMEPILKLVGFEVVWKGLTQKFVKARRS